MLGELESGERVDISRLRPDFFAPRAHTGRPLGDRHLSRRAVAVERCDDGWRISAADTPIPLRVDGRSVDSYSTVTPVALQRGVVLELAERVVLLLHRHIPSTEPEVEIADLIGDSDAMADVRREIGRVADQGVGVLVRGETGTGKELVARALHSLSLRSGGPFVAVNLGALPPSLAVSELFGAARGAFTGASGPRLGCFTQADGGTLFLDEIGEASPEVQVAMLRTLETGEVQPLGEAKSRWIDVRTVAATDADLEQRIADGHFKEPLLHRLAGYEILLPPLRQRRPDIGRLLLHFLRQQTTELGEDRFGTTGEPWIDSRLMSRLARFDWPGNVRQLRNVARQLAIGNRGRPCLAAVPAVERLLGGASGQDPSSAVSPPAGEQPPPRRPADIDDAEFLAVLRRERFEIKAAARSLGISRAALYSWIEQSPHARTAGQLDSDAVLHAYRELDGDLDALVDHLQVSRFALRRKLRELGL